MKFDWVSFVVTLFFAISFSLFILLKIEEPVPGKLRNGSNIDKFLHSDKPRLWLVVGGALFGLLWYFFGHLLSPNFYTPAWEGTTKGLITTTISGFMAGVLFYTTRAILASFFLFVRTGGKVKDFSLRAGRRVKERLAHRRARKKLKRIKNAP